MTSLFVWVDFGNNFTRGEDIKWKKTIVKRAVPVFFLMKG